MKTNKIKNTLLALLLATGISFTTSPVQAGGFPVGDLSNLAQQLVNYLNYMQQLAEQIEHTKNQIEQLKQTATPTIQSLKAINSLTLSLQKSYEMWNKTAGLYNTVNEMFNDYEQTQKELEAADIECANGGKCDYDRVKALNSRKKNIMNNYRALLKQSYNQMDDIIKANEELQKEMSKSISDACDGANTIGYLTTCNAALQKLLIEQNFKLHKQILEIKQNDYKLTTAKEEYQWFENDKEIGSNFNPDLVKKEKK